MRCFSGLLGALLLSVTACHAQHPAAPLTLRQRLSQPVHVAAPTSALADRQVFLIETWSETPQPVTWDPQFKAGYGMPLPKSTRGGSTYELWGFRYHADEGVLRFFATTPLAEEPLR